ncbi:MAG: hypothetical protein KME25_32550 [Symplocastrum torsivum CPER-KK1]|uniref:Uncharacterized protein n=1 Tax=Symplocastrum torsivum CPER-KK1 TaxID=450513 RepID=A0A951PRT2_9CYAN|nr:hypothetical protein [Symplocastrum torsivum CPER-KK1]
MRQWLKPLVDENPSAFCPLPYFQIRCQQKQAEHLQLFTCILKDSASGGCY